MRGEESKQERRRFSLSEVIQCLQRKAGNFLPRKLCWKGVRQELAWPPRVLSFPTFTFKLQPFAFGPGQDSYLSGLSEKARSRWRLGVPTMRGHWVGSYVCSVLPPNPGLCSLPKTTVSFLRRSQHKFRGRMTWVLFYNPFVEIPRTEIIQPKVKNLEAKDSQGTE